jgi:cyclophilin family peptidyl-prolyl cis-trans isomerase
VDPSEAQVTDRVYMNVRVSRQDGTFYVRDDLPDTAENRVFQGRLVVGLFGKAAPTSVERFLSYVDPGDASQLDDNPPPTYGRSYFPALDPATGLLAGGAIPSLQLTEVGGSAALQYGGRLLPARLWIEPPADRMERVSHVRKGLLTHRVLDPTPAFGITTRSDTRELDGTHTVFGALAMDEGDAAEFLDIVRDLPTYSVDGPPPPLAGPAGDPAAAAESLVGGAAGAIFSAQRSFFRGTAKALGDTRLDKVYDGKLLRRIEVVRVGRLGK